ncbi:MAG: ATP-binding cassette domain-containing protein [Firmicutes bacterium]|nr:ATP-binding cassette domain-containing protein [Bacillota bacterium]
MLKLKNISKTYSTLSGASVKALDGVSTSFKDTGLVFVCGKSGSGKTTLINILSGMDICDDYAKEESEFMILDREFSLMSNSDLDAYRNSYVGYVFQDFGLMNELDVAENVALSKTLQNESVINDEVEEVLKKVGLNEHGKRKVYELSGGQKQRVSVARALIKNPKILFADEPTGNLDSETSKQIFELFKELSKTMLVIVVTHDIESAWIFGDRIISLEYGKVVADKKKRQEIDFDEIKKDYLKKINEHFEDEVLEEISAETEYTPQKFVKKKSKMPLGVALRLCLSSIKARKVRFIFTILLTTLALTVFILADFMNRYDYESAVLSTMNRHGINTLILTGRGYATNANTGEVSMISIPLHSYMVDYLLDEIDNPTFLAMPIAGMNIPLYGGGVGSVWRTPINSVIPMHSELNDENLTDFFGATLLSGEFPRFQNERILEVLLSDYMADNFFRNGGASFHNRRLAPLSSFVPEGDTLSLLEEMRLQEEFNKNLIGANFVFFGIEFRISGIFSTDFRDVHDDEDGRKRFNSMNVWSHLLTIRCCHFYFMRQNFSQSGVVFATISGSRREDLQAIRAVYDNQMLALTFMGAELWGMQMVFGLIGTLLQWGSLVLFFFAMLLVFNFISSSVTSKQSDIGILRTMGAKNRDTAKVFAFEGGIITVLSVVFATLLALLGIPLLNIALSAEFVTRLNVLTFQPLSVLFGALATIATVALALTISLWRISRMKAIDASKRRN